MTSSSDVFAKRREGQLDEAYQMALQRMAAPDKDEWDDKAFGWCLVDLIKRDTKAGKQDNLGHYRQQLEAIDVPARDEVLSKQRKYAISLCDPNGQLLAKARELSKSGRHGEAANLYRQVCASGAANQDIYTYLGWELYRICKALLANEPPNIPHIKKLLNEYLQLKVEKPSLLHSVILQLASKLAGAERFNMAAFTRIWGLEYLRPDDWERFVTDDNKTMPSLAEKVVQRASKEAVKNNDQNTLAYILPYLDKATEKYTDNIWLILNKAKALLAVGKADDALAFAIEVTRAKTNDYWAWELLGDISKGSASDMALSCYCRALLCPADDQFTGKVRLKLAVLLAGRGQFSEAKYEINRVLVSKERSSNKTPPELERLIAQPWYPEAVLPLSNEQLYLSNREAAEELLFSQIPWIAANVGEVFTVPGKENKPRRKLYIQTASVPVEVAVPEGKFSLPVATAGGAICVKGEWDPQQRFQVYMITCRDASERWDIFTEHVGVVDNVNEQKKLIHFIVDKKISGIIPFSDLDAVFHLGDTIALRLARYSSKQGERYRVIASAKTDSEPPSSLKKAFLEEVSISNELGFTRSRIFIPAPLVKKKGISDGDTVSGIALLNYDRKRSEWSWKAIQVTAERSP